MRGKYVLAAACVVAIGVPSAAVGFGEGRNLKLGKRNPSPNASLALNRETEIIADSETYGTRQSNKRDGDGGGAIYGCRSDVGREPCLRASNLKGGRAFEFATTGKEGGRIDVGDTTGAPFTTNATGVATGLNADRVDGRDASELAAAGDLLFAVVDEKQAIGAKRGAVSATLADAAKNTVAVTFDREVKGCSFTASPSGESTATALGVSAGTDPKTVLVDRPDDTPDTNDTDPAPIAFHVQVIC